MIAFVQCDNFIMLVDKENLSVSDEKILEQNCRVFNTRTQRLSPVSIIGSWVCRIGPWESVKPNTYTTEEVDKWLTR